MLRSLFFLLPGLLFFHPVFPDAPRPGIPPQKIAYPLLLEDPGKQLTISDVVARSGDFKRSADAVAVPGATSSAWWVKFDVENPVDETLYLSIASAGLQEIDLYHETIPGQFSNVRYRSGAAGDGRIIQSNMPLLPMHAPPAKRTTYYLRVTGNAVMRLRMEVAAIEYHLETQHEDDFIHGIFYGILLALMIYNLFAFITLRDISYLLYVLYILFSGLSTLVLNNYIAVFFPSARWLNEMTTVLPGGMLFGVLFTNTFLRVKEHAPLVHKLRVPLTVFLIAIPVMALFVPWPVMYIVLEAAIYVTFAYWLAAGISVYVKGFPPAVYFLAGFGLLIVFGVVYNLRDNGLLPDNAFTRHAAQLGTALEAIILSWALTSKLNFYKRAKEALQLQAMEQSSAFSKEMIRMQEHERKRIASELHDSVGQQLILIKNRLLLLRNKTENDAQSISGDIAGNVADTIQEIRNISYSLRPYQMEMMGLTQSIQSLAEETGDGANILMDAGIDNIDHLFSPENEINIYRIVQELLNNMVKHSGATRCTLRVHRAIWLIKIVVTDDGVGFGNANENGFGLLSIRERVQIMGGQFIIHPGEGKGAALSVNIPISYHENT
ncbi:sensor histidine kinase [Chitinophaga rhizosphaerae]|uniref:sensor histidine kinase n=1 Tax=Chitinophaga rhizosphaerae TaxID=1864947 RepID=UPI000F80AE84|nr:7TM diverse intracellular signaling domain-containing protein [Chitinophaga rhizosphaerae]